MSLLLQLMACVPSDYDLQHRFDPPPPFTSEELISVCEPPIEEATPIDLTTTPPTLDEAGFATLTELHDYWIDSVEARLPDGKTYQDLLDGKVSYHLEVRTVDPNWATIPVNYFSMTFNTGPILDYDFEGKQSISEFGCDIDFLLGVDGVNHVPSIPLVQINSFARDAVYETQTYAISTPFGENDIVSRPVLVDGSLNRNWTTCTTTEQARDYLYCGAGIFEEIEEDQVLGEVECDTATEPCLLSSTNLSPSDDSGTVTGRVKSLVENMLAQNRGGKFFYDADGQ